MERMASPGSLLLVGEYKSLFRGMRQEHREMEKIFPLDYENLVSNRLTGGSKY